MLIARSKLSLELNYYMVIQIIRSIINIVEDIAEKKYIFVIRSMMGYLPEQFPLSISIVKKLVSLMKDPYLYASLIFSRNKCPKCHLVQPLSEVLFTLKLRLIYWVINVSKLCIILKCSQLHKMHNSPSYPNKPISDHASP